MKNNIAKKIFLMALLTAMILSSAGCSKKAPEGQDALASFPVSDLSSYDSMKEYDGDIMLKDITVADMDDLIRKGESFVVFFSYANCPYCNRLMPYLNRAASDAGMHVGYIDTRRDPSWQSNMDIEGYDIVVDEFGSWLDKDSEGKLHLYTPDMYFIKEGEVAARHSGVTPGADDPSAELTAEQEKTLLSDLAEAFGAIK